MKKKKPEKILNERLENLYAGTGGKTFQYPPGFVPDGNITYEGKKGKAKLSLPALVEIMKQIGPRPRIFTMDIKLIEIGAPLENTIWMTSDIAAAIEDHMITSKEKAEIKEPVAPETEAYYESDVSAEDE